MLGTCPEVIVSVGSAAEADSLLATFLSTHPLRESAPQWLLEEAIPQAIRRLVEQVLSPSVRFPPLREGNRIERVPSAGRGSLQEGVHKNGRVVPRIEISIWLTTSDEIASLNARYRGIDAPTDVLSFPAGATPAPTPEITLGDVVVSVEQAAQQAEPNGHDFLTELLMLCLHGALHLLGYDDRTEAQRARMNQIAARTLRALGYAAKEEWSSRHYEG
jgi:probable rRNA maturation factor